MLDATHDPTLRSWVDGANEPTTDFPIQNLPFGVFRAPDRDAARIGIAIGDQILDAQAAVRAGLLDEIPDVGRAAVHAALGESTLNALMALGRDGARVVRRAASRLLRVGGEAAGRAARMRGQLLVPMAEATMVLPAQIGDYTDFYASIHHATNIGVMLRPDQPLMPNYKWIPIGYHGRASSVVPSGVAVRRPSGQLRPDPAADPFVAPTRSLDYELELGAYVCGEQALGQTVPIARAESRLFGICLLNDWSARDVQGWEYQPLGPFLAKSFTTSVSPWVVTLDALAPFRCASYARPAGDPAPLPYLSDADDVARGAFDIRLEVWLQSAAMRATGIPATQVCGADFRSMYWTFAQMLTHHASNGCNLRPGDLLGSGTVSGPGATERGSMMELTMRGRTPVVLPSGETRAFLADGDVVTFRGWCERDGAVRIGFGECRGEVLAAE